MERLIKEFKNLKIKACSAEIAAGAYVNLVLFHSNFLQGTLGDEMAPISHSCCPHLCYSEKGPIKYEKKEGAAQDRAENVEKSKNSHILPASWARN